MNECKPLSVGGEMTLARTTSYLQHPVFNSYHSEHEMVRYLKRLVGRCRLTL